jgi:hypothetical protein
MVLAVPALTPLRSPGQAYTVCTYPIILASNGTDIDKSKLGSEAVKAELNAKCALVRLVMSGME